MNRRVGARGLQNRTESDRLHPHRLQCRRNTTHRLHVGVPSHQSPDARLRRNAAHGDSPGWSGAEPWAFVWRGPRGSTPYWLSPVAPSGTSGSVSSQAARDSRASASMERSAIRASRWANNRFGTLLRLTFGIRPRRRSPEEAACPHAAIPASAGWGHPAFNRTPLATGNSPSNLNLET